MSQRRTHTSTHRAAPQLAPQATTIRRAGTPAAMLAALAAACVLAACGPDDPTDQVAQAPLELIIDQPAAPPASEPPVTVPAALVKPVADGNGRVAPRPVFGQVSAIEPIRSSPRTNGTGAVVGGVLGAVVGNQIGSGSGRAAATVLGGVGGAVVGNKVEKHRSEDVVGYRVHVQLDNGRNRSFERTSLNGLDVGDRVRVDGGRLREI